MIKFQTRYRSMMQLPIFIGCCIILLLAIAGCREVNGVLYSKFYDLPSGGWDPVKTIGYDPWPADSADAVGAFDLYACVRYSGKNPMPPLKFMVACEDETGAIGTDTITLQLFDDNGKPLGHGRYGVCEMPVAVMQNFSLRPGFGCDLRSLTPMADSKGLLSVGVMLLRHGASPYVTPW